MDRDIEVFVSAWLRDNAAIIYEIVELQGDDPRTAYGAALEACMASMPKWTPHRANDQKASDAPLTLAPTPSTS